MLPDRKRQSDGMVAKPLLWFPVTPLKALGVPGAPGVPRVAGDTGVQDGVPPTGPVRLRLRRTFVGTRTDTRRTGRRAPTTPVVGPSQRHSSVVLPRTGPETGAGTDRPGPVDPTSSRPEWDRRCTGESDYVRGRGCGGGC